jgi:phosphoribosylglycinamide formyltransferase-1
VKLRLALFASGGGTNALNLLKTAKDLKNLSFDLLMVDQKSSPLPALVAKEYPHVLVAVIPSPEAEDAKQRKIQHEQQILSILEECKIDWIFLAGYMRIIGPTLLSAFTTHGKSRVVNIHPSLLPAYPGLHAYERAFQANEDMSGVTIHLVDSGVDTGPILFQESFERKETEDLVQFIERGKSLEWQLYAKALKQLDERGEL